MSDNEAETENKKINSWLGKQRIYLKILLLFLGFVIFIQIVGLLSFHYNFLRLTDLDPWQPSYSNINVPVLARWDSGWYVAVLRYGYFYNIHNYSTTVFFPLFPLLMKGVSEIFPVNYYYAGEIVSWAALLAALYFFYKLLRLDYEKKFAFRTLFYLLIFPWSFFLAAVYTESLFLFLLIAGFYYARKNNWPLAGVFGFLGGLTRITGIFLLPALLWEYYQQHNTFALKSLWLILVPAGLATFMVYLKYQTGYFFSFYYGQTAFGRQATFPILTLWLDFKNIVYFTRSHQLLKAAVFGLPYLVLAVGLVLLVQKYKQIRASYLVFAGLAILLPLCTGTTTSLGRYLLPAFPIFIAASLTENRLFKSAWFGLGLVFLSIFVYSFVGWYFIV